MQEIKRYIDTHFDETLKNIIKIINIPSIKGVATTVAPFGVSVASALTETLEIAQKLGFKTVNLDNYIGYAEYGDGKEYIAVLGHLDVVPINNLEKWNTPPFNATIIGDELYGRGALDDKSPIISSLFSLKALVECEKGFKGRVRIIFGTNEESGDSDIKYYLAHEKPPKYCFTPDGRFPVIYAEKGIYTFKFEFEKNKKSSLISIKAGNRSNVIPDECIAVLENSPIISEKVKDNFEMVENKIVIKTFGKSGHASHPECGDNALIKMYEMLDKILPQDDGFKPFISFISKYFKDYYGEKIGVDYENELGKLTINPAITEIENNRIFVKFNMRYPYSEKYCFEEQFENIAKKEKIIFTKNNHNPPLYYSKNSTLVKKLQKVYNDITKRMEEPSAVSGGTYAKLMPNTVAFGPNYKEFVGNIHAPNEHINLTMLKESMLIYAMAIYELSK